MIKITTQHYLYTSVIEGRIDGILNGPRSTIGPTGSHSILENYKNGKLHGKKTVYTERKGMLLTQENYFEDQLDGESMQMYNDTNITKNYHFYTKGIIVETKEWYPSGLRRAHWLASSTKYIRWYNNGNPEYICHHPNEGEHKNWNYEGELERWGYTINGRNVLFNLRIKLIWLKYRNKLKKAFYHRITTCIQGNSNLPYQISYLTTGYIYKTDFFDKKL